MRALRIVPVLFAFLPLSARAAAPSISARSLRISPAVFAPATVSHDLSLSTGALDAGKFFSSLHLRTYAVLDRVGGYYESGAWVPEGSAPIVFRYLSSVYRSVLEAGAAYGDADSAFNSGRIGSGLLPCASSTHLPSPCAGIAVHFKQGPVLLFREVLVGRCVAEVTASVNGAAEATANRSQVEHTSDAISRAAVAAMSGVCGKTQEGRIGLSVDKFLIVKEAGMKSQLTRSVRLNQATVFLVYFRMSGIAVPDSVVILRRGKKALGAVPMHLVVPRTGEPYFTATVRFSQASYVGKLSVQAVLRAGKVSTSSTLPFTITR